jgi:hypothetical protein
LLRAPVREALRFTARGHQAVRATHHKTLEFTAESSITERATCVLGVAAALPARPVAGPLRFTITAGSSSVTGTATGNSAWRPGTSAVFRRSPERLPDTLATDCSLVSSAIPRELARELADPATTVTVVLEPGEEPEHGRLIRLHLAGAEDSRLAAELEAADLVLAADPAARRWLLRAGVRPGRPAEAETVLANRGRVLSVSTVAQPAAPELFRAAPVVEVIGVPIELAVCLAVSDPAPVLLALDAGPRELAGLAAGSPSAAVIFRCAGEDLAATVDRLDRPAAQLVVARSADPERPFILDRSATVAVAGELVCRLGADARAMAAPLDPARFVRSLLTASVTPRTVALALAELPGWSRRSAYDFVLAQTDAGVSEG